jgi:DNA-binding GntR family transcriptional regulator
MEIDVSEPLLVEGRSLTSIAFDRLRNDVIRGELRPGDRLRVQALCSRYSIGATAIREALSRLVTEGLVQVEDQRGFLVMPVSKNDLLDLTETRVDVESLALTRAIERGDTAWEADLLASYHRLSKCPPPVSLEAAVVWGEKHRSFHATLLAGCGSVWLLTLCNLLYDKSERYRYLANIRSAPQSTQRKDEHGELLAAALKRDAASASQCLAQHYRHTTDIIMKSPDTLALFEPPSKARGRTAARL